MKVKIKRLDDFGRGIGIIDGKITFVDGAYTGDLVKIEITKSYKKYNEAIIKEVIERGNIYEDNMCPNKCGGCSLNVSLEEEIKYKNDLIKSFFKEYEIRDLVYGNRVNYRNKITLRYDKVLGLYEEKSKRIVEINTCLLVTERINKTILLVKKIIEGNIHPLTIIIKDLNGILININGDISSNAIEKLKEIPNVLYVNDKCYSDKKYLEYNDLLIGPNSFFQVNNEITEKLYDEILLNLDSGVGSISKHISSRVTEVLGIEIVKEATDLANLRRVKNTSFKYGDVEKYIDLFNNYNKVILDPPRSGVSKKVIDKLNSLNFDKIIYVSCNIRTLKRDIDYLTNYKVEYIKGFNMFPYTYHVEVICVLTKRNKE